ncbi:NAD-dependent epimerase/dehydratase family protein [Saccharothrix longispora]|uniref:Nucleoside-diphosphate-sugar epimerase n=1 Tax=Saccharothrix longispora TaxID=33920 RepID=A0ABU1PR78_9PSEU|nr:NAD(P)-dependent oxidoreductase [Saccharothrix longispora]MDR6593140.1 nucleoside-diphosphate-sugar epimerase [Saccharothrix longispora]
MEIVGRGFVARNLSRVAHRHPHALVLAAGVSSTSVLSREMFSREADLVLDALDRCRRGDRTLVFFSSASHAMYGSTTSPAREDVPTSTDSAYGDHKRRLEALVRSSGVPWLILRMSHAIGCWQREHQLLPNFVKQIGSGSVKLYEGTYRDLVDVLDVVRAVDALLDLGVRDEVVNVASGTPWPVADLARAMADRMGASPVYEVVHATPVRTLVSVDKLCRLVPDLGRVREPGYVEDMLDRYIGHYWPAPAPA